MGAERVIRISKPAEPPAILRDRGEAARDALCRAYDAAPDSYRDGSRKLESDADIYGHASVVEALAQAQHRKCCFCERKLLGDVEHYRPKNGYQQRKGEKLNRPGYYWLAYEWTNLFRACGPCNQRFKRNLFPLANPAGRARSHRDDLSTERPLLLHPSEDEPEQHISFREEVAFAVRGSRRGRETIAVVGLNHAEALESRRGTYAALAALRGTQRTLRAFLTEHFPEASRVPADLSSKLRENDAVLAAARRDDAEYAAMARAALAA